MIDWIRKILVPEYIESASLKRENDMLRYNIRKTQAALDNYAKLYMEEKVKREALEAANSRS